VILAGDIGGTKCNLAVFEEHGSSLQLIFKRRYATNEFASLEKLIERFFCECASETGTMPGGNMAAAGFGVAGAVVDGRLVANNIPWELTAPTLARNLNLDIEQLALINDLVATAYGLVHLAPQDFLVLNAGTPQINGNQALIAAGTGLGEAMIIWDGSQHRASPSEGGAADFAPRTEREIQLLHFLKERLPRVSCEEIFSGRGFRKLHEFLDPAVVHPTFGEAESASASEITQNALTGTCPVCVEVLDGSSDVWRSGKRFGQRDYTERTNRHVSGVRRSAGLVDRCVWRRGWKFSTACPCVWRRVLCGRNRFENTFEIGAEQLLPVVRGQGAAEFGAVQDSDFRGFE